MARIDELDADPKNYCRVEILGQLFGVSTRRIQTLTTEGVFESSKIKENGKIVTRYNTLICTKKYIKYLSDKAYGREQHNKENELRQKKLEADIALKETQGDLHKLKMEIASGKYIDTESVKADYSRFFIGFKKFAMSIPSRVSGLITSEVEPIRIRQLEKEMSEEINKALTDFVVKGSSEETAPAAALPKRGRPKKKTT